MIGYMMKKLSPLLQTHHLIRLTKSWRTAEPLTVMAMDEVVMDTFLQESQQVALEVLRSGRPPRLELTTRSKERKRTEGDA